MTRVGVHQAQQNFANNPAAERPETFTAVESANAENFRLAKVVIPKRCSFTQPAPPQKFVSFLIKSHPVWSERLYAGDPRRFLSGRQTDSRSAQQSHFRQRRRLVLVRNRHRRRWEIEHVFRDQG